MEETQHTEVTRTRTTTSPARRTGMLANILAIVGFIILIIIVIWGLIHLARLTAPWLSDIFRGDNNSEIKVTAPAQVAAGSPLAISWKHTTDTRGTYAFLYQCANGLKISVPTGDGSSPIPCGAAFTLGNATGTAIMIPTLTGTTSVRANISVLFLPSAAGTTGPEASGSAIVQVVTAGSQPQNPPVVVNPKPTPTPTPKPTPTPRPTPKPTPTYPAPRPVTPADLAVRIVAVGVIDGATGAFVQRAPYSQSEVAAVQFDIQNVGGSHSGTYTFQAQIPTSQPYTYQSQAQMSLAPGAHVINTLRFSPAVNGTFAVSVFGSDARTSNNHASQWVTGVYNYGYQNQPVQYQPQYPAYPNPYGYQY